MLNPQTTETPTTNSTNNSSPPPPQRQHWRKFVFILGGAGAIATIAFWLRPTPIAVDLGTIERGELQVTIDAEGKTRVRDRFLVNAPIAGQLQRIPLQEGDFVTRGMVVAQIDPLPYTSQVQATQFRLQALQAQLAGVDTQRPKTATLEQARSRIDMAKATEKQVQAMVARAEAELDQAVQDRERAAQLSAEGVIPKADLEAAQLAETTARKNLEAERRQRDRAQADIAAAQDALTVLQAEQRDPDYLQTVYRSEIQALRAELAQLSDEAQRTAIAAPSAGQVFRVLAKSGGYVTAGMPLLEIGDTQKLELVIDVLSTDAVQIQAGDPILIRTDNRDFRGRVNYIEPSAFTEISALGVEEQRVNVIGEFVESGVNWGDGYRVDTQIVIWQADDVLKIPISALFRCAENWCAFVVKNGRVERQQLEIGQRNDFAAEVKTGVKERDRVILHPTEQIKPGIRVRDRASLAE